MKYSKYNLMVTKNSEQYYIFNTLNGNCIEVSSEVAAYVKNGVINSLCEEDANLLIKSGIIIEDYIDENRIISYFHDKDKFSLNYFSSTVLLTRNCNLKCIYCFEGESNNAVMNIVQADKYIKFVKNKTTKNGTKNIHICLFGGEPLVNFKIGEYILEQINNYCEENDMNFSSSIITNGTLVNRKVIEKLIKYKCMSVQITLDGTKEIHDSRRMRKDNKGSFDIIINNLNLLKEYKQQLHTVIRINVDNINKNITSDLLDIIGKRGLDFTDFNVDFGIVRGMSDACSIYSDNCLEEEDVGDVLYKLWNYAESQGFRINVRPLRRWLYCGLYNEGQFTVDPECKVYKCWEQVGIKEHLMGEIDDYGNLIKVQYAFYDWMSHDPLKIDDCRKCVYLPCCGGGCAVTSYYREKSYHSKGCFKIRGVIEKQVLKYIENLKHLDMNQLSNNS